MTLSMNHLFFHPERIRQNKSLRDLVQETHLEVRDLVCPIFLVQGHGIQESITSMPGVFRYSVDKAVDFVRENRDQGLVSFLLFGVIENHLKDSTGHLAYHSQGPVPQALSLLSREFPDLLFMADACFCEYTDHGHCGPRDPSEKGALLNSRNIEMTHRGLAEIATCYAEAGAQIIAPSIALDGMVQTVREALDRKGHFKTAICSYAVKYASSFYGPFREAAGSTPEKGTDRKTYQMNPANKKEALLEASLDVEQGADLLLIKPAISYLDVLSEVSKKSVVPVGAYQVSGEYAMIKAAGEKNWVQEDHVFYESLLSIKRAGAKFIVSYWAPRFAEIHKSRSFL
jgi:porphobilinogen synthase